MCEVLPESRTARTLPESSILSIACASAYVWYKLSRPRLTLAHISSSSSSELRFRHKFTKPSHKIGWLEGVCSSSSAVSHTSASSRDAAASTVTSGVDRAPDHPRRTRMCRPIAFTCECSNLTSRSDTPLAQEPPHTSKIALGITSAKTAPSTLLPTPSIGLSIPKCSIGGLKHDASVSIQSSNSSWSGASTAITISRDPTRIVLSHSSSETPVPFRSPAPRSRAATQNP
mmetsp:Transcript_16793/g.54915  ORF Transcript_16793/g.54915 Transcript_16793/m.54915 type:complete len:230 (-) Transcript_16793:518-1207(-)